MDTTDWKDKYEKCCKEWTETDKEFALYNLTIDQNTFNAFEGSADQLNWFKKGYETAKSHYDETVQIRTKMLRDEQFFLRKKTKELIQAEQKIKDLIAECKLYSDNMHEIESHKLTKCVRFLQSFNRRLKYKFRDIYWGSRSFLRAFLPKQYDTRSTLYRTLKEHLNKKDVDGASQRIDTEK